MKKLLPFLIAFIFVVNIKAQSPVLTFTNVTGSNSITCNTPGINYLASVSNYTNGPLTYTWVSLSGSATGTNVTFNSPAQYTLTAYNTANSFSLSQVFAIGLNTTIPTSTVTPLLQNINCLTSSAIATFTGITTSTLTNVTHSWQSPYSNGSAVNGGTISIINFAGPGTYTYCLTNNINGCSTCKTVSITSTSGYPTYSITSSTQFSLGCGSNSTSSISISNVATYPSPGPVSYTVLSPFYAGPSYTLGASITYTAGVPGQYTVIVHDNTNGCETQIPVSIISNTVPPQISASTNQPTLTCFVPKTLLYGSSTNTNVSFSWSSPGFPVIQSPYDTLTVISTTNVTSTVVATYTLSVMDNTSLCKNTQTLTVYQNTSRPTAQITGSNVISCSSPTLFLANASISNVPPVFSPTQPVVAVAWYGPAPQASLANSPVYVAYTPANATNSYSLIVQDLNNGCTSVATKTIADARVYPIVSSPPAFNINCPTPTVTIYPIVTGPTAGFGYSWTAPPSASVSNSTQSLVIANAPGLYTITVTNFVNSCVTTTLINVAVCAVVKQNSFDNNIHIFPNPNNGSFAINITTPLNDAEIEIYNILGSKIKTQKIISGKNDINLQDQNNGVYFIYLTENKKIIQVSKIVKQ